MAEAKTWTEKGPGRKQCPECKIFHGVRRKRCPKCGHEHVRKISKREPEPRRRSTSKSSAPPKPRQRQDGRMALAIPNGKCPVRLESSDSSAVRAWAKDVVQHIEASGRYRATTEALAYWLRLELDGEELEIAMQHLEMA